VNCRRVSVCIERHVPKSNDGKKGDSAHSYGVKCFCRTLGPKNGRLHKFTGKFLDRFCWFLPWITFQFLRRTRYVPPKRRALYELHGFTTQNTQPFLSCTSWYLTYEFSSNANILCGTQL
jgi:hypothetical protein